MSNPSSKGTKGTPPISYARQRTDGSWYVSVTWENGRREQIGRFKTEAEAEAAISRQLDAWHEGQEIHGAADD